MFVFFQQGTHPQSTYNTMYPYSLNVPQMMAQSWPAGGLDPGLVSIEAICLAYRQRRAASQQVAGQATSRTQFQSNSPTCGPPPKNQDAIATQLNTSFFLGFFKTFFVWYEISISSILLSFCFEFFSWKWSFASYYYYYASRPDVLDSFIIYEFLNQLFLFIF